MKDNPPINNALQSIAITLSAIHAAYTIAFAKKSISRVKIAAHTIAIASLIIQITDASIAAFSIAFALNQKKLIIIRTIIITCYIQMTNNSPQQETEQQIKKQLDNIKQHETELKINKQLANIKQLFSNNLHHDDYYDLLVSGAISLFELFSKKITSNKICDIALQIPDCNHVNTIRRIVDICEKSQNIALPIFCISILTAKNLYYDMKHLHIIHKYYSKLRKATKTYIKQTNNVHNRANDILPILNSYRQITSSKYFSKYMIPLSICAGIYTKDVIFAVPLLVSSAVYLFIKYYESEFIENNIDKLD